MNPYASFGLFCLIEASERLPNIDLHAAKGGQFWTVMQHVRTSVVETTSSLKSYTCRMHYIYIIYIYIYVTYKHLNYYQ